MSTCTLTLVCQYSSDYGNPLGGKESVVTSSPLNVGKSQVYAKAVIGGNLITEA